MPHYVRYRTAGVSLDRALFPLLMRLDGAGAPMAVARLADQVKRDPSTVSRQLAKLESLGLIKRPSVREDARLRAAGIKTGARTVVALRDARRRLLGQLSEWSEAKCETFARLAQRPADAMKQRQREVNGAPVDT